MRPCPIPADNLTGPGGFPAADKEVRRLKLYDITKELLSVPAQDGIPQASLRKLLDLEKGDLCNESALSTCVHIGTHCDGFCHFIPGGDDIASLPLDYFVGPCQVLRVPRDCRLSPGHLRDRILPGTTRLLLCGGGNTYLSPQAAEFLASSGIRTVGTDAWSVAGSGDEAATHTALLGRRVAVIEDLALADIPEGTYFLSAAPMKLAGSDGAHCRAFLMEASFPT